MYPSEAEPKSQSKILRSNHSRRRKIALRRFRTQYQDEHHVKLTLTKHTTDAQFIKAKLIYGIYYPTHTQHSRILKFIGILANI